MPQQEHSTCIHMNFEDKFLRSRIVPLIRCVVISSSSPLLLSLFIFLFFFLFFRRCLSSCDSFRYIFSSQFICNVRLTFCVSHEHEKCEYRARNEIKIPHNSDNHLFFPFFFFFLLLLWRAMKFAKRT